MGIHNSSAFSTERRFAKKKRIAQFQLLIMKVFATVAAILALASAEPEPGYYNAGYYRSTGYHGHGGVAHHPYGGSSYRGRTVYGYPGHYLHKREAEADAEPGYVGHYYQPARSYSFGYNVHQSHPGYARSYQYRSQAGVGGHHIHKREADAEPGYGYSYRPSYSAVSHYQPSYSYGYNIHQSHPGYAHSYQSRYQSAGHYLHKREADAEPGYGYAGHHGYSSYRSTGYHGHGYARATSYVAPTTYGYPSHGYSRSSYYH